MPESQEEPPAPSSRWQRFAEGLNRALCTAGRWLGSDSLTLLLIPLTAAVFLSHVGAAWRDSPDSALYLSLARSLARGEGFTYLGQIHIHAMPGFPLMLAAAEKMGLSEIWQLNFLMALGALALCWLSWLLALLVTDRALANLTVFCVALSEIVLLWSRHLLTEIPFAVLVVLVMVCAVLAYRKGHLSVAWASAAGVAGAAAFLVRVNGAAIFPALFVWLWFTVPKTQPRWKRCTITAIFMLAGLIPTTWWLVRTKKYARPHTNTYLKGAKRHALTCLPNAGRNVWALARNFGGTYSRKAMGGKGRTVLRVAWLLAAAGGAVLLIRKRRVLLPAVIVGQFLMVGLARPLPRYMFCVYAPTVILGLLAATALARRRRLAGRLVVGVLLCVIVAQAGVVLWKSQKERPPGPKFAESFRLADWLKRWPQGTRIYARQGRRIHYLSGRPARNLPKRFSVREFPAFYRRHGELDLLVFDEGRYPRDAEIRKVAETMAGWGAFRLRRLRPPGLERLIIYKVERPPPGRAVRE